MQRWEKELALPVHRIGTEREIVYALVSELGAWEASSAAARAARESGDPPGEWELTTGPTTPPEQAQETRARFGSAWWVSIGLLAGAAVIAALAGMLAWNRRAGPAEGRQPDSWKVANNALSIYDAKGQLLWEHRFEFTLTREAYSTGWAAEEDHRPVLIHDVDGDGDSEVLFVSEPWRPSGQGLFCFNRDGSLRFQHTPARVVRFGGKTYGPPWRGSDVMATGATGQPHDIWFVSTHLKEFPTVLERLDASGSLRGEYWSNGQILRVVTGDVSGRPVVFVGAISNEFRGGSLAVLDAARPSGSAPAASNHYRCEGCPPGSPITFLVFPRLDVTTAIDGYSQVVNVFVDRLGQVMVGLRHEAGEQLPPDVRTGAESHYVLDTEFRVTSAELGRRLPLVHRALEASGLLDHAFDAERDGRDMWPVLRWTGTEFAKVTGPEAGR